MRDLVIALKVLVVMTLLTGIAYPLIVTTVGHVLARNQADGSLIRADKQLIGSLLVGQKFADSSYFWTRPSATDYNPLPSSGSNLGPTSAILKDSVSARLSRLWRANGEQPSADLLCASASGLDPDISPEGARCQVERVARVRHLDLRHKRVLLDLIEKRTENPTLGIFGQPRVNVLRLNLAVDSLTKASK